MTTISNVLAEQAVLGCILQTDFAYAAELLALLHVQDFTEPRHRVVYEAAKSCIEANIAPDPVTVLGRLREQGEALADTAASSAGPFLLDLMRAAPSLGSATYYVKAMLEDAFRRRVQEAGERFCQVSETGSVDVVLSVLRSEWTAIAQFRDRLPEVIA